MEIKKNVCLIYSNMENGSWFTSLAINILRKRLLLPTGSSVCVGSGPRRKHNFFSLESIQTTKSRIMIYQSVVLYPVTSNRDEMKCMG